MIQFPRNTTKKKCIYYVNRMRRNNLITAAESPAESDACRQDYCLLGESKPPLGNSICIFHARRLTGGTGGGERDAG